MTDLQIERLESKLDQAIDSIDKLNALMTGNGNPANGIIVRFDRVEQKVKWIWAAIGVALVAIVKAFWSVITGK